MNSITRNRATVAIVMALLALAVYGLHFFGVIPRSQVLVGDGAFDPVAAGNRIELAVPFIDVLHIGVVEQGTLGVKAFHVGVLAELPRNPYAVELATEAPYPILSPDEYTWNEETGDDNRRYWTPAKAQYYSDNALFRPGEAQKVKDAISYLHQWHEETVLAEFFFAVFQEAWPHKDEWNVVEISFLGLQEGTMMPGIDEDGEPGYVVGMPPVLQLITTCYKKEALPEPKLGAQEDDAMAGYYMHKAIEQGSLSREKFAALMDAQTIQFMQAYHPALGRIPYTHGYNHPWKADDVKD